MRDPREEETLVQAELALQSRAAQLVCLRCAAVVPLYRTTSPSGKPAEVWGNRSLCSGRLWLRAASSIYLVCMQYNHILNVPGTHLGNPTVKCHLSEDKHLPA